MENKRIGAVQLGQLTGKHFIIDLLPKGYEEIVYEEERFYSCKCKNIAGKYMEDSAWDNFCEKLEEEFGDNLMEIYSITSGGINFVVYLKKSAND